MKHNEEALKVFSSMSSMEICKAVEYKLEEQYGKVPEIDKIWLSIIEKDLEVLDFFKKLFVDIMPIRLTDLQDEKYLSIPNSDIRRPDTLLPITEKEYELLKEWFRSNLLKEWLGNE